MSHEYGIRHSGLSGTLIEDQFISYLRKDIKKFKFFNGHISKDGEFSNQYDVIICKKHFAEDKRYKKFNKYINVIPLRFVVGVIEIKKWTSDDFFKVGGKLATAKENLESFAKAVPYFFVAVRIHDNNCGGKFYPGNRPPNDNCYFFFGDGTSGGRKSSVYPWLDPGWADFENKCPYKGEYERLVETIKQLPK